MAFKDIIGHSEVISNLKRKIKENRIHHAILFYGPKGIGKRTLATEFIKAINCKNYEDDLCDSCNNCKWINDKTHPDVVFITNGIRAESLQIKILSRKDGSDEDNRSEMGSSSKRDITIDQIRYLEEVIYTRPIEGRYRVVFIIDAENMNKSSANAFLKTLEEPPESTLIVMTTSCMGMIPATIRSRTEKIRLSPLNNREMEALLKERLNYNSKYLNVIIRILKGSLNKSILEIDEESFGEFLKLISRLIKAKKVSIEEVLNTAESITRGADREERDTRIEVFLNILKELALDLYLNRNKDIWSKYDITEGAVDIDTIRVINDTINFIRRSSDLYCNQSVALKSELLRLMDKWNRLSV